MHPHFQVSDKTSFNKNNQLIEDQIGWYDKIQILDFGLTHKTGGANHKINDFCFVKFFLLEFGMTLFNFF